MSFEHSMVEQLKLMKKMYPEKLSKFMKMLDHSSKFYSKITLALLFDCKLIDNLA